MAITKTTFTGTSRAEQYSDLLLWLQTNASDYFDSITGNGTQIICKIGELECLTFFMSATTDIIWLQPKHAQGYGQHTTKLNAKTDTIFNYGVVTSKGLMLDWIYTSSSYRCGLFISKNSDGKVCAVALNVEMNTGTSTDNTAYWATYDFESNPLTNTTAQNAGWTFGRYVIYGHLQMSQPYAQYLTSTAPCTALSGVPLPSGLYCNNILTIRFSEYWKQSGKLTLNDAEYYTNGFLCLAD